MRKNITARHRKIMYLCLVVLVGCFMCYAVPVRAENPFKKKIYLKHYTPGNVAIKSALCPGWGQYANRQYGKAYLVAATEIAALAAAGALYYLADEKFDEYKEDGLKDGSAYDDYETYHQGSLIAGGVAVVVWIYSITEAYVYARDEIQRRNESTWHIDFDSRRVVLAYKKKF